MLLYTKVCFYQYRLEDAVCGLDTALSQTFASLTFPNHPGTELTLEVPHTVPLVGD